MTAEIRGLSRRLVDDGFAPWLYEVDRAPTRTGYVHKNQAGA
ncbi:MAG TPA: hypothetical protein VGO80_08455 [Solirubrobacteraceae bacterium]|jgi:hypothetical protein|nr:hypothetical protein [Solirubrobacteraceae bacterium]